MFRRSSGRNCRAPESVASANFTWGQCLGAAVRGRWSVGQELEETNATHFYSCGLVWGKPSSQINVVMWWLNLMTWEIPVLEFLRNCNNDLFLRVAFITHLLRCWLHANLGYSIICCIETEQLDLFLSVEEKQNLSKFKTGNLKMLFIILDPQFH